VNLEKTNSTATKYEIGVVVPACGPIVEFGASPGDPIDCFSEFL